MEFKDWLKHELVKRDWRDVQLCAALAALGYTVHQFTVRAWLDKGQHPRAHLVTGLCAIFECTPADMFPLPRKAVA